MRESEKENSINPPTKKKKKAKQDEEEVKGTESRKHNTVW